MISSMKTILWTILATLGVATSCHAQTVYNEDALNEDYESNYIAGVPSDSVDDYNYDYSDSRAVAERVQNNRYRDDNRYGRRPSRYPSEDRLSREENETRVMRERVRREHMANNIERDGSFTEVYESNNRAQERSNVLGTINEASGTVRDISNTIKYIENLF